MGMLRGRTLHREQCICPGMIQFAFAQPASRSLLLWSSMDLVGARKETVHGRPSQHHWRSASCLYSGVRRALLAMSTCMRCLFSPEGMHMAFQPLTSPDIMTVVSLLLHNQHCHARFGLKLCIMRCCKPVKLQSLAYENLSHCRTSLSAGTSTSKPTFSMIINSSGLHLVIG